MSDLMMLPPLHNLRLGDSTGVSLEFAKVKQGGDEYMDDDIVKKPVDDFIDKNTASMALQLTRSFCISGAFRFVTT